MRRYIKRSDISKAAKLFLGVEAHTDSTCDVEWRSEGDDRSHEDFVGEMER